MDRYYRDPAGTTWVEDSRLTTGVSYLWPAHQENGVWQPDYLAGEQREISTADLAAWQRIPTDDRIARLLVLLGPVLDNLPAATVGPIREALAAVVDIPDEVRAARIGAVRNAARRRR